MRINYSKGEREGEKGNVTHNSILFQKIEMQLFTEQRLSALKLLNGVLTRKLFGVHLALLDNL